MVDTRYFIQIFKSIPLPAVLLSHDGSVFKIEEVNNAWTKSSRTNGQNIVGKDIIDDFYRHRLFEENDERALRNALHAVVDLKAPQKLFSQKLRIPARGSRNDITQYWDLENVPLMDDQKEVAYILHTIQDVADGHFNKKNNPATKEKIMTGREGVTLVEKLSQTGSWEIDLVTGESYWSDEFFKICGYEPQSFVPTVEKGFELIHPDDRERAKTVFKGNTEGEDSHRLVIRMVRKDNEVIHVLFTGLIIKNQEGNVVKFVGLIQDISNSIEMEKTLEESVKKLLSRNELVETILEHLPIGISVNKMDDGTTTLINKHFVDIFGWELDEIRDMKEFFYKVYPDEPSRDEILVQVMEDIKSGEPDRLMWENLHLTTANGEKKIINARNIPLPEYNLMISASVDVTLQATQAAEINQTKLNQEALINNTDDLLWSIDTKCRIITTNRAYQKMMKFATNKMVNPGDSVFVGEFGEELNNKWREYYNRVLNGEKFTIKEKIFNPSNQRFEFGVITLTPMYNAEGKIWGSANYSKDITEEVLRIEALENAKAELSKIMDFSLDVICTFDEEGKFIKASAVAYEMWGYHPEELVGRPFTNFMHPEDLEKTYMAIAEVTSGARFTNFENRFIHKKGYLVPLVWSIRWDAEEKVLFCIAKDATEKLKAEEELKNSEEKHKLLFQYSPLPKWIYEIDSFEILDVNIAAITSYGYTRDEFLSMTILDLRPEGDKAYMTSLRDKIRNIEGIQNFGIFNHLKKNGTLIKAEVFGSRIKYLGKDCMIVVCPDVTAREKAEEKLSTERNLLRTLVDNLPDYIYVKDRNLRHLINNKANLELIGAASEEETIGKTVLDYFEADVARHFIEDDRKVLEYQKPVYDREELIITKNGDEKWLLTTKVPLKDANDEVIGLVGISKDISQHKIRDQHLKLLESVITNINDAVMVTEAALIDEPGPRIIYVNQAFTQMTGYEAEEVIGKNPRMLQGPKTDRDALKRLRRALELKEFCEITTINYKKNGEEFWINITVNPLKNEKGIYTHFIAIQRDVTDKKHQEQRLIQANQKIANTLESIQDGFYALRNDWTVSYWNREAEKLLGVNREDILGKNLWERYSDLISLKFFSEYHRCMKERIPVRFEEYYPTKKTWYDVSAYPSEDGITVYFKDTTSRKKAELEILKIYEERNTILESIGDAFFAVNKKWIVTYWNKEAEKVLGRKKYEIVGKNLWKVFKDAAQTNLRTLFQKAMNENTAQHFEAYYKTLKAWYEISVYPSGKGLSVYFRDTTERKLYEIRLNDLNQSLQKYAKDLAISNKELEHFAYVASHDLQEPLRMVTSFLTLIEKKYDDVLDSRGKQYIYFAVDGARRMRQIILDLLEFSRVGRWEENTEEIDLNELVNEIISLYRKQIKDTHATIEFKNLLTIKANKTPLRQVFHNIIGNALKYHKKDEHPIIAISSEDTPTHWKVIIRDNGIGIDKEYYEKIFIIFQRLHNKDDYSGTGIGLAICKKIIENMGGRIWLESEEGKGSTFYFTIAKPDN